jgi:hypothetical protein
MKTRVGISLLTSVILVVSAVGQDQTHATVRDDALFLINKSKPYLYVVVDHVGPRGPLRNGEPKTGLWLHLVNNCRLSIVVVGSKPPVSSEAKARWIEDEVIPNKPSMGTESVASGIGYRKGQDDLTDIYLSPNDSEAEVRSAERPANERGQASSVNRPHGYNERDEPSAAFLNVIPPGSQMSFSLPSNHVDPLWHIQIPFRFALKHQDKLRQPYSYVALFWDDLSDGDRSLILKSKASESTNFGDAPIPQAKGIGSPR